MIKVSKHHHVHKMSKNNEPCIRVVSGDRLLVETWDALEGESRNIFDNKIPHRQVFPSANPATGPIFVEDAHPGDVLEVEIHDIKCDRFGFMTQRRNRFTKDGPSDDSVYVQVEVQGDELIYDGLKLPLEPMIGVIGTAPLEDMWCQECGDHGSNMDNKLIKKGAKVLLPVFVEGGLLAMGDVHAVMGDGEVFGQGIEIGAQIDITVRVRRDLSLKRPMIILEDRIATVASNKDIGIAEDQAISDMGLYLINVLGFTPLNASIIIAFYGDLRFCQVCNPQKTVRMEIKNKYINLFAKKKQ
jgi:amidase